jgi:hypothetical protein
MMRPRLVALVLCLAPSIASAQVVIEPAPVPMPPPPQVMAPPLPPPVYPPPPPRYYTPRPQVYVAPPPLPPQYYGAPGAMPPHVYIRERIRWHLRRAPRVIIMPPAPYVAPAPPAVVIETAPPTQYYAPPVAPLPPVPPPVIVPPPCCYYSAPAYAPPEEVVLVKPRAVVPMWKSRIGLGVRGTGQVLDDGWNNLGIGGEFLYRASPHLVTELAAEYQRSTATALDRVDIPVTFGLRVHIGRPTWVVSPYFVFAGGVGYASQDLKFTHDDAIYVEGQLGGGLELRLGEHLAITADARLSAKKRANDPAENVVATSSVDGKPVHPLGDEVGGQFRLGVAAYF